ncbi:MAG: hypothetical protein D4R65_15485 [Verrucomicrobiaceae bacterium]|nr:MAG: hypothetical protein D4R65_15485 [Verrucomicrobiaceae bacterium]
MISSFLTLVIRIAILAVFTFLFVVLFDHGPDDYLTNVRKDFTRLVDAVAPMISPAGTKSPASGT